MTQSKRIQVGVSNFRQCLVMVVTATSTIFIMGCGAPRNEHQRFTKAPLNESDLGVSVAGLDSSRVDQILNTNPNIKVRKINSSHGVYEFRGVTEGELVDLIDDPNVVVETNSLKPMQGVSSSLPTLEADFQKLQDDPKSKFKLVTRHPLVSAIERNFGVHLSQDHVNFLSSCDLKLETAPDLILSANQSLSNDGKFLSFNLGTALKMSNENSKAKNGSQKLSSFWILVSPTDSTLEPIMSRKSRIDFLPDATGLHLAATVVRDDSNHCALGIQRIHVSSNEKYAPVTILPRSLSKKISQQTFWHVFHVESESTWNKAEGEGVLIAILDSGVNYNHPALAENIYVKSSEIPDNGLDDDQNGLVDDSSGYDFANDDPYAFDDVGHGSHVAGIAASPIFGAAKQAKILPIKVGSASAFDIGTLAGAIYYAVDENAKIINLSLGGRGDSELVRLAVAYAESKNVLIVVAAGNNGTDNSIQDFYPSNIQRPNVLSVASVDEKNQLTEYSNFGSLVHLGAPGGTPDRPIVSAYKSNPKNKLLTGLSGTSMATPLVAGAAAQLWSANPKLTAVEVRELLLSKGRVALGLEGKTSSGRVLDVTSSLAELIPDLNDSRTRLASSPSSL